MVYKMGYLPMDVDHNCVWVTEVFCSQVDGGVAGEALVLLMG